MEVLFFQIGIFVIIFIAALFSKQAKILITILMVLFTIVMVFSSGLMILQFATIAVAYALSPSKEENKPSQPKKDRTTISEYIGMAGCSTIVVLIILVPIVEFFGDEKTNNIEETKVSKEIDYSKFTKERQEKEIFKRINTYRNIDDSKSENNSIEDDDVYLNEIFNDTIWDDYVGDDVNIDLVEGYEDTINRNTDKNVWKNFDFNYSSDDYEYDNEEYNFSDDN